MSLQPNNGCTGAQVADLARQSPSQSLCLEQRWPPSRVGFTQACAPVSPAPSQDPPFLPQRISSGDFGLAGTAGTAGTAGAGTSAGAAASGVTGETGGTGFAAVSAATGLGFGRRATPAAAASGASSSDVTVIADPATGLPAAGFAAPGNPATQPDCRPRASRAAKNVKRRRSFIGGGSCQNCANKASSRPPMQGFKTVAGGRGGRHQSRPEPGWAGAAPRPRLRSPVAPCCWPR